MNEEDLNIKYIREKTGLVENDELIPIILEMVQESYKAGLCQAEYDNTMNLIEENQQLKEQLEKERKARKEFIEYINVTEYSDIVGLNNNGIKEFWFMKDLLEILDNKGSDNNEKNKF